MFCVIKYITSLAVFVVLLAMLQGSAENQYINVSIITQNTNSSHIIYVASYMHACLLLLCASQDAIQY